MLNESVPFDWMVSTNLLSARHHLTLYTYENRKTPYTHTQYQPIPFKLIPNIHLVHTIPTVSVPFESVSYVESDSQKTIGESATRNRFWRFVGPKELGQSDVSTMEGLLKT